MHLCLEMTHLDKSYCLKDLLTPDKLIEWQMLIIGSHVSTLMKKTRFFETDRKR